MKKLLFITSLILSAFAGFSQVPIGCPTCVTEVKGTLKVDSLFLIPLRNDTLVAPGRPGALVNAYGQSWLYTGTQWALLTGVAWGSIPGNITAQTDLMVLLNAKQNQISNGYGWKLVGAVGSVDSAVFRKVDTIIKVNDSTLSFSINGRTLPPLIIRGSASGTVVSSISLTVPTALFTSPVNLVNTAGNWVGTLSLATQGANTVLAGPVTGSAAQPTFRVLQTADLPTGIPISNLAFNFIGFGIDNTGITPTWSGSSVPLGTTVTLHLPLINAGITSGLVTSSLFAYWNSKVDSTTRSNDSIYEWRNGFSFYRYRLIAGGSDSGLNVLPTSLPGVTMKMGTAAGPTRNLLYDTTHTNPAAIVTQQWRRALEDSINALLAGKQPAGNYITGTTGDVVATGPGSVSATIQANAVTNAKAAQMPANTIKGNNTGSTANASDLTAAQVAAMLPTFTTSANGLVPQSVTSNTTDYLRRDGTWATPPGTGGTTFANPTATIGLTAVNGTATSAIRSDAAPALSQAIVPTWSGVHTFSTPPIFSGLSGVVHANGSSAITATSVNNSDLTAMAATTIKANITGGLANPTDATPAQINAILPTFTSSLNGLVPFPGGSPTGSKILADNGTWITPPGVGVSDSGFNVLPANLAASSVPIVKGVAGAVRNILYDTSAGNPGAITTKASRQKVIDTLNRTGGYVNNDTTMKLGNWAFHSGIQAGGKTLNFQGDSWTAGSGASSPTTTSFPAIVSGATGATMGQNGVAGMTLETDGTGNNYQGVPSIIQRLSTIPNNSTSTAGIILEFGLNDLPPVGSYNLTHFASAWDTLLRHVIDTAHYARREVAIMGMPWIPDATLTYYGTISGGTAPTRARLLQYDSVIQAVCMKWGVPYIPCYYQLKDNMNDSSHYVTTGQLHLDDFGHKFYGYNIIQKMSLQTGSPWTISAGNIQAVTTPANVNLSTAGTGVSTSTPNFIDWGDRYGNVEGPSQLKAIFYNDGTVNNRFGVGVYSGKMMIHAGGASTVMDFWIGGSQYMSLSTSALTLNGATQNKFQFRNTTSSGVTTPDQMNVGGTFFNSSVFDSSKTKYTWYQSGSSAFGGIGINTLGSYLVTPHGFPFYVQYDNTSALIVDKYLTASNYASFGNGSLYDSTNYKPLVVNQTSGKVSQTYWSGFAGSGGSTPNISSVLNVGNQAANANWNYNGFWVKKNGLSQDTTNSAFILGKHKDSTEFEMPFSAVSQYLTQDTTDFTNGLTATTISPTHISVALTTAKFTSTADASSITNTTSTLGVIGTGVGSLTIPANTLQVGNIVTLEGFIFVDSYASGSLSIQSAFGGSGGSSINFTPLGTGTNVPIHVIFRYVVTATGTSGTIQEMGSAVMGSNLGVQTNATTPLPINTTTTNATNVLFQFGTASASNTAHGLAGWRLTVY